MSNPILVEVLRGALVESRHSGAVAVVDADGGRVLALGDVEQLVYPRSAVKALQAFPLSRAGRPTACSRTGGTGARLRLAFRRARSMWRRRCPHAGARRPRTRGAQCGAHWPIHQPSAHALARAGRQRRALSTTIARASTQGFCAWPAPLEADRTRYTDPAHPVQRAVRATLEGLTGAGNRRGCLRGRWLLGADLGAAARGAGARLCAVRHGPGLTPERAKAAAAAARGLRRASLARRGHRPLLHRGDAGASARGCS